MGPTGLSEAGGPAVCLQALVVVRGPTSVPFWSHPFVEECESIHAGRALHTNVTFDLQGALCFNVSPS